MNYNSTWCRRRDRRQQNKKPWTYVQDQQQELDLLEDPINQPANWQWFVKDLIEALLALAVLLFVSAVVIGAVYL